MQELGTALENVYKHALGDRNELLTGVRFGNDILLNPAAKEVELLAKFTPYAPERRKPLTKDRSAARRKGMYKEDGSEDEEEDGEEDAWMERLKNNEGIPCLKKFVIKLNRLQADQRDEIDQLNAKRVREIATFRAKVEARRGQKDYDLLAKELERVERSSAQEAASDWRIRDSSMARQAAEFLRKELDRQLKKIGILKKEEETFTKLANSRIEYFRFLQKLSDEVVEHGKFFQCTSKWCSNFFNLSSSEPVDNPRDEIQNIVAEIDKTKTRIVQAEGRRRYLQTLMEEEKQGSGASSTTIDEVAAATASAARAQSERECGICKMGYTKGFLLPCAHAYCEVCTKAWITVHRKCPLCNEPATAQTLTPVSFQMIQPLSGLLQTSSLSASQYIAASSRRQEEETADETFLKDLAKIRIDRSYGVKFDTILRHVIHLRGKDPAAKVLIFSQWQQVLAILKKAFSQNGLRYVDLDSSVSKKDAVSRFTKDTNISAFFLHATSQSQGLTLVVAKHVFLCEP